MEKQLPAAAARLFGAGNRDDRHYVHVAHNHLQSPLRPVSSYAQKRKSPPSGDKAPSSGRDLFRDSAETPQSAVTAGGGSGGGDSSAAPTPAWLSAPRNDPASAGAKPGLLVGGLGGPVWYPTDRQREVAEQQGRDGVQSLENYLS